VSHDALPVTSTATGEAPGAPATATPDGRRTSGARPARRGALALGGAAVLGVAGAGALTACGSDSSGAIAAAGTAGPADGATSPGDSSSPAAPKAALAKLADVPVGGALVVAGPGGQPIVLTQPTAGHVAAVSALCTHQGCKVLYLGGQLDCPCHGSQFDLTGKVLQGPARTALPRIPVKVSGPDIVSG